MKSVSGHIPYGAQPPVSWKLVPLKHLTNLRNGYVFKGDELAEHGNPIIRIENLNGSDVFNSSSLSLPARYHVHQGDLLFAWSGNPGTSFGPFRWKRQGLYYLNQHIFKVDVHGCTDSWLFWVLKAATHWIERELTSGMIGMVHVTKEDLGNVLIPVPSVEEQNRITEFLDNETTRIEKLAALLTVTQSRLLERRATGILNAVTGGDLGQCRPSGLAWTETLPSHWKTAKLSFLARMGSGHTPSRSHPEWWEDCTIPWITTGEVSQVRDDRREEIFETREYISKLGLANSAAELCPKGTVVLCRTASAGYSGVMGQAMATSQDFVTWQCSPKIDPFYLLWSLRAMRPDLLGRLAMGSTHKTIYVPDLQMLRVAVPPITEQHVIVENIRAQNRRIDELADAVEKQLALLAERRQALITAAVTGQFDVTTARKGS